MQQCVMLRVGYLAFLYMDTYPVHIGNVCSKTNPWTAGAHAALHVTQPSGA